MTVAVKIRSASPVAHQQQQAQAQAQAQAQVQAQVQAHGGTLHEGGWAVLVAHSKLSSGRWPRAGTVTRKVGAFVRGLFQTGAAEVGGAAGLGRNEAVMKWVLRLNGLSLENAADPGVLDVSPNTSIFPSPFHPPDPSLPLALDNGINAMLEGKGDGTGEGAFILPMSAVLAAVGDTSETSRWPPGPIPVVLLGTCLRLSTLRRFLVFDSRVGTRVGIGAGAGAGIGAGGEEAASPLSLTIFPSPSAGQDRPISGPGSVSASQSVFVALTQSGEGERDGGRERAELGYADDWEDRDSRPDRDCPLSPFPSPGQSPLGSLQLSQSEEQERVEVP